MILSYIIVIWIYIYILIYIPWYSYNVYIYIYSINIYYIINILCYPISWSSHSHSLKDFSRLLRDSTAPLSKISFSTLSNSLVMVLSWLVKSQLSENQQMVCIYLYILYILYIYTLYIIYIYTHMYIYIYHTNEWHFSSYRFFRVKAKQF